MTGAPVLTRFCAGRNAVEREEFIDIGQRGYNDGHNIIQYKMHEVQREEERGRSSHNTVQPWL